MIINYLNYLMHFIFVDFTITVNIIHFKSLVLNLWFFIFFSYLCCFSVQNSVWIIQKIQPSTLKISVSHTWPSLASSDGHRWHPTALYRPRMIPWFHSLTASDGGIGGHAWLVFSVWYCTFNLYTLLYGIFIQKLNKNSNIVSQWEIHTVQRSRDNHNKSVKLYS